MSTTTISTALTVLDRVAGVIRAVMYLRVSTEDQVKGYGLSYSKRKGDAYIARKGWTLVGIYADEGVSGTLEASHRPDLKRLMEDARRSPKPMDMVVVNEGRVIGRAGRAFWPWVWELEKLGIFVAVISKDYDNSTPDGRSKMRKDADYAEDEREAILSRTQNGLQDHALGGGWTGGPPAYGYRIENQGVLGESRLAMDDDEARILREARRLYVAHRSWGKVADKLNIQGSEWYDRNGDPWHRQSIKRVVTNSTVLDAQFTFRGAHARKDEDGNPVYGEPVIVKVSAIFTPDEVQELRDAMASSVRAKPAREREYPLTSRIASACGSHYHGSTPAGPESYVCKRRYALQKDRRCTCPKLPAVELEQRVWGEIGGFLGDGERLRQAAERWAGRPDAGVDFAARIAEFDEQIRQQDAIIALTMTAAARQAIVAGLTGKAADDAVEQALKPLSEERANLARLRAQTAAWAADAAAAEQTARDVQTLAEMARDRLVDLPPQDQTMIYRLLDIRVHLLGKPTSARAGRKCEIRAWFEANNRAVPVESPAMWEATEQALAGLPERLPPSARLAVGGLLHKARTGCRWADLPGEYGSPGRVRTWWWLWRQETWSVLMDALAGLPAEPLPSQDRLPEIRIEGTLRPGLLTKTNLVAADGQPTLSDASHGFRFDLSLAA